MARLYFLLAALACVGFIAASHDAATPLANEPRQLDDLPADLATTLRTAHAEAQRLASSAKEAGARADAWGRLAMLYHGQRLHSLAEHAYGRAVAEADSPRWRYLRAIVLSEQGDIERAVADFRHAAQSWPEDATARYRFGVALLLTGDVAGAATELEAANRARPNSALILSALADVAMAREDATTALTLLQRAWELEPQAGQLAYKLAMAQRGLGNMAAAREWLDRQPDNSLAPSINDPLLLEVARTSRSARFHEMAAEWALARGDREQAAAALRQAVELAPADAALRLRLSAVLGAAGQREEALAETRQALAVDADSAQGWYLLAWLLAKSEDAADWQEAARAAARSLALHDDGQIRALAAALAMRAGRFAAATAHFQRLVERDATQAAHHYWLGLAQLGAGDCDGRQALKRALQLRTNWGQAHLALARADAACGDGAAAMRRARALLTAKNETDTRLALAFVELHLGRRQEAAELAKPELPHPDARLVIDALHSESTAQLPVFAAESEWWLPAEVR